MTFYADAEHRTTRIITALLERETPKISIVGLRDIIWRSAISGFWYVALSSTIALPRDAFKVCSGINTFYVDAKHQTMHPSTIPAKVDKAFARR